MTAKNENIKIRSAVNSDLPGIVRLVKSVLSEFDLSFDPYTSDKDLNDIEDAYLNRGGSFEVVLNGKNEIIGTAGLYHENALQGTLRKMYLHKEYRNKGIGRILLERILAIAVEKNYQSIILETNSSMTSAIRLYEKAGFIRVNKENPVSPRCNIVMQKNISS